MSVVGVDSNMISFCCVAQKAGNNRSLRVINVISSAGRTLLLCLQFQT
jgi:hypothetical protein